MNTLSVNQLLSLSFLIKRYEDGMNFVNPDLDDNQNLLPMYLRSCSVERKEEAQMHITQLVNKILGEAYFQMNEAASSALDGTLKPTHSIEVLEEYISILRLEEKWVKVHNKRKAMAE